MRPVHGRALLTRGGPLEPYDFEHRDLRPHDVAVRTDFCGVCHSDLHAIDGASDGDLPLVPGHESTGTVVAVGVDVTDFAVGDRVAVGNMADSCGVCPECVGGHENYCREFPTLTYGGADRLDGMPQRGSYSSEYVIRDAWTYHLPDGLDPAAAAPLLCAGVTVWEPLRRWQVGPGSAVGVVGLGGLGHLAVRLATALGARVTVFTTSPGKRQAALDLGAADVVVSSDADAMAALDYRHDLVLDTGAGAHDPSPYLRTLRLDGTLCMLGIPPTYEVDSMSLLRGRRNLTASGSASPASTRELLAFCAEHGVTADVEVLPADEVDSALQRLRDGDVRGRLVLDMSAWH